MGVIDARMSPISSGWFFDVSPSESLATSSYKVDPGVIPCVSSFDEAGRAMPPRSFLNVILSSLILSKMAKLILKYSMCSAPER